MEELKAEARAARPVEPVPPRPRARARASPTSSTRRCASSWVASRSPPEATNCSAPDTGNMEILAKFGTPLQQEQFLRPLARRRDPLVLRDDRAVGRQLRRHQHPEPHRARRRPLRDQRAQVVDERRGIGALQVRHPHGGVGSRRRSRTAATAWCSSRSTRRACRSSARSPCSATTRGGGHCETLFEDVRVPAEYLLGEEGGGFAHRAGPARSRPHPPLHARDRHGREGARADVRARAAARRVRQAARRPGRHPGPSIAESRIEIEQARLLTMKAAWLIDTVGEEGRPVRDLRDQGRRGAPRDDGHRPRDPGLRRAPASPTTGRSPRCTRTRARCTSSTVPTRCTCSRSPAASCARTKQFRRELARP